MCFSYALTNFTIEQPVIRHQFPHKGSVITAAHTMIYGKVHAENPDGNGLL